MLFLLVCVLWITFGGSFLVCFVGGLFARAERLQHGIYSNFVCTLSFPQFLLPIISKDDYLHCHYYVFISLVDGTAGSVILFAELILESIHHSSPWLLCTISHGMYWNGDCFRLQNTVQDL